MPQFSDLTSEQQEAIKQFEITARPGSGTLFRFLNKVDIMKPTLGPLKALLGSLDAGAVVPNHSGLAGAQPLTKEQLLAIITVMESLLTGFYTDDLRALATAAAGAQNLISVDG